MHEQQLIPHLFRTEFRKIVSVLSKYFGMDGMEKAEDIASETFLSALEIWPYKGIPENPTAWLYTVAKNKAKNYLHRNQVFSSSVSMQVKDSSDEILLPDIDISSKNIDDSQLQMMFAICHPAISMEAQIGLSLRILCGFGIDEIADALLTNKETINKRLFRAREKLREENVRIEFPSEKDINERLEAVLRTLYLLFSEGYYSESKDTVLQKDLCLEAMQLVYLLTENEKTNLPEVNALLALMCFQASRFEARQNDSGEMILYHDQDETLWNRELITRGIFFLNKAASGNRISKYHLEANIAYWYTIKEDTREKWESILQFYNQLLMLEYSPLAALNRTYALSKANGKREAIIEAEKLNLNDNHFYFTLLGELYKDVDNSKSKMNFQKALSMAKTNAEKKIIQRSLDNL